jgi:hypothetical protein
MLAASRAAAAEVSCFGAEDVPVVTPACAVRDRHAGGVGPAFIALDISTAASGRSSAP